MGKSVMVIKEFLEQSKMLVSAGKLVRFVVLVITRHNDRNKFESKCGNKRSLICKVKKTRRHHPKAILCILDSIFLEEYN